MIDYTDKETIKNILRRYKRIEEESERGNYEAMELIIDIENLKSRVKLTAREEEILELYRQGYNQYEVADEMRVFQESIARSTDNICNKLLKAVNNN